MKPMLAKSIEVEDLDRYIDDDEWLFQQKLDGDRLLIVTEGGEVRALNREGEARSNAVPQAVLNQFASMPTAMVFDGELLDGTLWLFDLPHAGEAVTTSNPYDFRSSVLQTFFEGWAPDPCVQLLANYEGPSDKRWIAEAIERNSGEGVMAKRRNAVYRPGKRSYSMVKAKFTKEVDVVVSALGLEGKNNAAMVVYDANGRPVDVGTVSLNGKPPVTVGQVMVVRCLYATADHRLFQPRVIRVRDDKAAKACTIDQLSYTDRRVILPSEKRCA